MPADLAGRVLEEPRFFAAQFAGLPGTFPRSRAMRAPDLYVTNAVGTFEVCGEDSYSLIEP